MTKITVGIPASRTRFLVQAISSVLAQTFTDFELLISDDSPDGAVGEIVSRFQDPRIKLIAGPHRGLVANSANVWDNASADLLKFLHDDDELLPEALAEFVTLIEKNPNFTFAASRRLVIDEYGRELRRPITYLTDGWLWFEPSQIANQVVKTLSNGLGEPSNILIRRSAFGDSTCLGSFAGLPITRRMDVALLLNSALHGPCVATGKYLTAYREHPDQISAKVTAADFSMSLLEWEVCLRGAVALGLAEPRFAVDGVIRLEALYRRWAHVLPEVHHFHQQLGALRELLGAAARDVLTSAFRQDLAKAHRTVQIRANVQSKDEPAPAPGAESSAGQPPRRIAAKVDRVFRRGARGWAWIPEEPDARVHVEAVLDDRVVGHAVANVHRPDLAGWNVGASDYGFELNFYEPIHGEKAPHFRFFTQEEWVEIDLSLPPLDAAVAPGGAERPMREHARFTAPGIDFEEFDWRNLADMPHRVDGPAPVLIAFYLPQFHATAENDQNWGRGFTEWRQLPRGIARFPGHYQPRIPRDLGFYDLLSPQVLEQQCQMAQAAGISAFAFYYYWFNRKRVLDRPVELFMNADLRMPFFVIWANENWTRGWDGSEDQVLLKQDYALEDEDALLADLARHMRHPRHLRLGGHPLFVIYNPSAVPDTARTVARWRQKWAQDHGLEPLIYMAQTFQREDPRPYGLDGAMEFPPHKLGANLKTREVLDAFSRDFTSRVMRYDELIDASLGEPPKPFPLVKTAVPSWDNEPRRPNRGSLFEGSTPQKYQAWLQALIERAMDHPTHGLPVVAINAWNEWAEGAYLEPDVHYGAAYLNATARALAAAVRQRNALEHGAAETGVGS